MELFDLKDVELKKGELITCRTCEWRVRFKGYFSNKVTQRCSIQKNRIIKAKDKACAAYREEQSEF